MSEKNVVNFGATISEKLSNCRLRLQTSISRRYCYLQKKFLFFYDFLILAIKNGFFEEKKIWAWLSVLTSTCTEGLFKGKRISNKTKFFMNFLGFGPQRFRVFRKLPVRLSKPHSDRTNDHFVVNQIFVKKFFFNFFSRVRAENFGASGDVIAALLSNLHFVFPVDLSDTFSELFRDFKPFRDLSSKCWELHFKVLALSSQNSILCVQRIILIGN